MERVELVKVAGSSGTCRCRRLALLRPNGPPAGGRSLTPIFTGLGNSQATTACYPKAQNRVLCQIEALSYMTLVLKFRLGAHKPFFHKADLVMDHAIPRSVSKRHKNYCAYVAEAVGIVKLFGTQIVSSPSMSSVRRDEVGARHILTALHTFAAGYFTTRLRADWAGTAWRQPNDLLASKEAGFSHHLVKPFGPHHSLALITTLKN